MKYVFIVCLFLLAGCASDNSMPEGAGKTEPVKLGMTKEQVLKTMGHKPKRIEITPRGEVWHYDNVELAAIPFNFGFHPEFKNYVFSPEGVLIDFSVSQPTK